MPPYRRHVAARPGINAPLSTPRRGPTWHGCPPIDATSRPDLAWMPPYRPRVAARPGIDAPLSTPRRGSTWHQWPPIHAASRLDPAWMPPYRRRVAARPGMDTHPSWPRHRPTRRGRPLIACRFARIHPRCRPFAWRSGDDAPPLPPIPPPLAPLRPTLRAFLSRNDVSRGLLRVDGEVPPRTGPGTAAMRPGTAHGRASIPLLPTARPLYPPVPRRNSTCGSQ
jgi:hypothetical protein